MGLLHGIRTVFATTPNFISGFLMHLSPKPRKIRFKGSPPMEMTPLEYYTLKQAVFFGYSVNKFGEEWELAKGDIRFRMTSGTFTYVLWDEGMLSHYRSIDFRGKTVLDVGGYIGDTAVLFHHLGAKRFVIYEPVEEHIPLIKKNIELNHIDAEVKNLGVGRSRGSEDVPFSRLNLSFGLDKTKDPARETKTILLEDVKAVIDGSHADIAKFNCEGCEEALLYLDPESVRKIPVYVMEMHEEGLERRLLDMFDGAGYRSIKTTRTPGQHPLHTLERT